MKVNDVLELLRGLPLDAEIEEINEQNGKISILFVTDYHPIDKEQKKRRPRPPDAAVTQP